MQITKTLFLALLSIYFTVANAAIKPLTCFTVQTSTGSWSPSITFKNNCGSAVDLQNALITFISNQQHTGSFWGSFASLAYPSNTNISSSPQNDEFLVSMPLTFPTGNQWWKPNTELNAGESIKVQFSGSPQTVLKDIAIYPKTTPDVKKGEITLSLGNQPYSQASTPMITVTNQTDFTKKIALSSWQQSHTLKDVPYGNYHVSAPTLEHNQTQYQAQINPSNVTISSSQSATNINISYEAIQKTGTVILTNPANQPEAGLGQSTIDVTDLTTHQQLTSFRLPWQGQYSLSNLIAGHQYQFKANTLQGKIHRYVVSFSPANTTIIEADTSKALQLNYQKQALTLKTLPINLSGLPAGTSTKIIAVDNLQHSYQIQLGNGAHPNWQLPINRQYQFSAASINAGDKDYSAYLTPTTLYLSNDSNPQLQINYSANTASYHFSPYVDVTLNNISKWSSDYKSMQPSGLLDVVKDANVNALHLAFITGQSGCQGTWAGYPVSTDNHGFGVPIFKQLKQQGVKLTVAMGGLSGQYLAQVCTSQAELVNAYETVISAYQPYGMDFDVENALQTDDVKLDRMMQAIKTIQQRHPELKISFTLPVLPSGLVPGVGENVIKRAALSGLSDYNVNIMAMDYGSYFTQKSMALYAIDAANNTFNQLKSYYPSQSDKTLWRRIEVTLMIGLNDTLPLNFSLDDAAVLKTFAKQKNLGMLSIWSINRDHPCASSYVNILCSSANPSTQQANQNEDYQYTKTLKP